MISISEVDILRSSHDDGIYLGSLAFTSSLTMHFYTNMSHDKLYHRDIVSSEYYLPIAHRFLTNHKIASKERKQTLLNSLNTLSMSPANTPFIESKYDPSMDPLACLDDDDVSNLRTEYLTHHVEDRVFVFRLSYAATDPLMIMTYTVETIELHAFLPRQVTPLVTATFACSEDEGVVIVGCSKGYICQYNLRFKSLQIVRHGLHSIDQIACHVVMRGTWILLTSQEQIASVFIPAEGFCESEYDPIVHIQPTDQSSVSTAPELSNPLEDSVWTECSSESETNEVSFLPPDSLFDALPSSDIIAPSSLQADNSLEETTPSLRRCFFQERDIVPLSHTSGQAVFLNENTSKSLRITQHVTLSLMMRKLVVALLSYEDASPAYHPDHVIPSRARIRGWW